MAKATPGTGSGWLASPPASTPLLLVPAALGSAAAGCNCCAATAAAAGPPSRCCAVAAAAAALAARTAATAAAAAAASSFCCLRHWTSSCIPSNSFCGCGSRVRSQQQRGQLGDKLLHSSTAASPPIARAQPLVFHSNRMRGEWHSKQGALPPLPSPTGLTCTTNQRLPPACATCFPTSNASIPAAPAHPLVVGRPQRLRGVLQQQRAPSQQQPQGRCGRSLGAADASEGAEGRSEVCAGGGATREGG